MARISVIMSTGGNRLPELERTLQSWSRVTHPDFEFILILNDFQSDEVGDLVQRYKFITKYKCTNSKPVPGNIIWAREGKAGSGEYIVFAMADVLLGTYNILEMMENSNKYQRASVLTYYTDEIEKDMLDGIDWINQPRLIEELPSFWTHTAVSGDPVSNEFGHDPRLTTYITGATREYWEWIGWFREDEFGYLNLDTDLVLRERFLKKMPVTVGWGYHQWHTPSKIPTEHKLGAYIYETEEQARLLSPARRGE